MPASLRRLLKWPAWTRRWQTQGELSAHHLIYPWRTKAPSHCLVFDNQPPNKYLSGTLISIQNSMLCFQTDNRTSRKKRTLPVLLTQQFKRRRKMRVSCYRRSYRGSNVGIQLAKLVDLGLDPQKDKSFRKPEPSLISCSTTPRQVKKKRKKQKATSEIMSSCWFRPSTVLSILIWRNCWLGAGPSAHSVSLVYNVPCLVPTTHFIALKLRGLMDPAWPTHHPSFLPSWGPWTLSKRSKEQYILLAGHTHAHAHTHTHAEVLKPLKSTR